jgi:electron transport complex protein RnfC
VLFLTNKEADMRLESPCLGCGRCIEHCSCHLAPVLIIRALKENNIDEAIKMGLMDGVECGSCGFVCPARVNLIQHFRIGKAIVREQRAAEKAKADAAKAKEQAATELKAAEGAK